MKLMTILILMQISFMAHSTDIITAQIAGAGLCYKDNGALQPSGDLSARAEYRCEYMANSLRMLSTPDLSVSANCRELTTQEEAMCGGHTGWKMYVLESNFKMNRIKLDKQLVENLHSTNVNDLDRSKAKEKIDSDNNSQPDAGQSIQK